MYKESRETVLKNLCAGQQWTHRRREQTYGHGERGGEGEMYGKSNMETYITICEIDSQGEFAVWLRKLKQGLCINLERWDARWMHETSARGWCTGKTQRDGMGREVGGGFRMWNTYKSMANSYQLMAKTTTIL